MKRCQDAYRRRFSVGDGDKRREIWIAASCALHASLVGRYFAAVGRLKARVVRAPVSVARARVNARARHARAFVNRPRFADLRAGPDERFARN